jgi:hypothetical protein
MAKYGSSVVTVTIDDSPGGTPRIITPYVNTISGLSIESITQQTNPFGTTNEEHTPVNMTKVADIVLSGFFDDTASVGSYTVLKPVAGDLAVSSVGRTLVVLSATGATFTITVHLCKFEVTNKNGNLTEYSCTLRQKSAGVWS